MTVRTVVFLLVLVFALGSFAWSMRRVIRLLRVGKPDDRFDRPLRRLANVISIALGQTKLLREPVPGLVHAAIFWGFVVLLAAVLETVGQGFSPEFSLSLLGPLYPILLFLEELMGLLVVGAVFVAFYRRLIVRPKRLEAGRHRKMDALVILAWIMFIMISMFGQNACNTSLTLPQTGRWVSSFLLPSLAGLNRSGLEIWFEIFWWLHIGLVFGFLNYLPYSKHFHVISSIPNVYLASLRPRGELPPLDLEAENAEKFGALDVEDLTWKQLLDGYTCTECGRCTAACPANYTGKLLSPKKVITDIRDRLKEKAVILVGGIEGPDAKQRTEEIGLRTLVHAHITDEELWACTTCMACVQECPVSIEHVPSIVEMRRGLVLTESQFPPELQTMYQNLERNFSPWAFSYLTRGDWAEGLGVKTLAEDSSPEYLFWVGCAGSFDARYRKVSRAFAELMERAGVSFGTLGSQEKCSGDPARRSGNEYLAQTLIKENVQTLSRYGVKKIVTACPHCFNTLKNEYGQFGGHFEVTHHTEFIRELIGRGALKVPALRAGAKRADNAEKKRVTFHDPCYLGRYNGVFDAPREDLATVAGMTLVEMKRSRDRSFCCGAGGGRMWMEERIGKRVNIERTEEAVSLRPDTIATACPFCMNMLSDGVKEKQLSDQVGVKDIAEILIEAIRTEEGAPTP